MEKSSQPTRNWILWSIKSRLARIGRQSDIHLSRNRHISSADVEFPLTPVEGKFAKIGLPYVPVTLSYEGSFPVEDALIDSGADVTLLPMDIRKYLGVELDESRSINIGSAGGGGFIAIPSKEKITFTIEKKGFRSIEWQGTPFFAPRQPVILLGHYQCLDQLDICIKGRKKIISIEKAK